MRVSDTYKLKLLQSKHDELLAAFDDVHQRLTALEVENDKLRVSYAVFQHHLEALHEEILGRIDSKIEDGQNHTDETLFLDGLLQSNLQILELCKSKSAAAALKETVDE